MLAFRQMLSTFVLAILPITQAILLLRLGELKEGRWGLVSVLLVLSALLGVGGWLYIRFGKSPSVAVWIMSLAILGPIGVLGCMTMFAVRLMSLRSMSTIGELNERLLPQVHNNRIRKIYTLLKRRQLEVKRAGCIVPFDSIMKYGSIDQKRSVLTLLGDNFRSEFGGVLQSALNDPEPSIRVQAATMAAKIENNYSLIAQSLMIGDNSQAVSDRQAHLSLAQNSALYARSGLLNPEGGRAELNVALAHYLKVLEGTPTDAGISAAAAEICLELNNLRGAQAVLAPWINETEVPSLLVAALSETFFRTRQFQRLRDLRDRTDCGVERSEEGTAQVVNQVDD